jgi:oxygen-independent coproporphyrinogen-3 oxidase
VWRGLALDEDDLVRADVIQGLMCRATVDIAAVESRHRIAFARYFSQALARLRPLEADGLVTITPAAIEATARGRLLLRLIAMCFDRYLEPAGGPAEAPRYSKVV